MEAPTSPVMPCKMELDKVMVSEGLRGAAVDKPGEHGAGGPQIPGATQETPPILTAALQGWEGEQELDLPALCRGMKGWQWQGMVLMGFCSPTEAVPGEAHLRLGQRGHG